MSDDGEAITRPAVEAMDSTPTVSQSFTGNAGTLLRSAAAAASAAAEELSDFVADPTAKDPANVLPPEVFLYMMAFVEASDATRLRLVSRDWRDLCSDSFLWREYFVKAYGGRALNWAAAQASEFEAATEDGAYGRPTIGDVLAVDDIPHYRDLYRFMKSPAPEIKVVDHFKELQKAKRVPINFLQKQKDLNAMMRGVLIDWMCEVQDEFNSHVDVLPLAVSIVDRFSSKVQVHRSWYQLLGITAFMIASKYQEVYNPLSPVECRYLCDDTFTVEEILEMELRVLDAISFDIYSPPVTFFLNSFIRTLCGGQPHPVEFPPRELQGYIEFALEEYGLSVHRPSELAAAVLCHHLRVLARLARKAGRPAMRSEYNVTHERITGVSTADAVMMADYLEAVIKVAYLEDQKLVVVTRLKNNLNKVPLDDDEKAANALVASDLIRDLLRRRDAVSRLKNTEPAPVDIPSPIRKREADAAASAAAAGAKDAKVSAKRQASIDHVVASMNLGPEDADLEQAIRASLANEPEPASDAEVDDSPPAADAPTTTAAAATTTTTTTTADAAAATPAVAVAAAAAVAATADMIESAKASGNAEAASQLEAVSSVVVEVKNKILEVQAKIDKATQAVGAATEQAEATAAEVEAAAAAAGALLGGASARNAHTTRRFVVDCAKKVESRYNGSVFYARDRWTNKRVVLMSLRTGTPNGAGMPHDNDGVTSDFIRQSAILSDLDHPNIVKMVGVFVNIPKGKVNLVTSYWKHTLKNALYPECTCPGQTTHEGRCRYVKSSVVTVNPDMMMVRRTVFQLLCALEYCHKRGILHRNIKPQRILIDGDGNVQLGGFSIARSVSYPSNYTTEVVTLWYRAPELLLGLGYSAEIDVWSVACVFAEMVCQQVLFPGASDIEQLGHIFKTCGRPRNEDCPTLAKAPMFVDAPTPRCGVWALDKVVPPFGEHGYELLNHMLECEPTKRISAFEALKHPFFAELPESKNWICCQTRAMFRGDETPVAPPPAPMADTPMVDAPAADKAVGEYADVDALEAQVRRATSA